MSTALERYGLIPTSVITLVARRTRYASEDPRNSNSSSLDKYATNSSRFPREVADFIYRYYVARSPEPRVLDPFSGWGERREAARALGIPYTGIDVAPTATCDIMASALALPFADNSFTHIVTCPPYFNLERYDDAPDQLSSSPSYGEFLASFALAVREWRRVLTDHPRPQVALVTGDFRRKGEYYPITEVTLRGGFKVFDTVILNSEKRMRIPMYIPQADRLGYTVKVHETLTVYRST